MITLIADVHVDNFPRWGGPERGGVNVRARYVLGALEDVVARAAGGPLVILGDLFNRCQPPPALLAHVQQILSSHVEQKFLLKGNHDEESGAYGHNALAPLAPVAQVVEEPTIAMCPDGELRKELWLCPFKPGPAKAWLPERLEEFAALSQRALHGMPGPDGGRALCVHMGLSDPKTPYYLDQSTGSMNVADMAALCKQYGITHVFAGDWHRHQKWTINGVHLMQVGSLCPSRFPPNYEHGDRGPMARWVGRRVTVTDIPGPRFYKMRWSGLDQAWRPGPNATPAFLKLTHRSDQADEAHEWVAALKVELGLLEDGGVLGGVEYDVDRGIERAKAKTASFEARQASSLDEAIARYVQRMPVADGVRRDAVLDNVRRLLG